MPVVADSLVLLRQTALRDTFIRAAFTTRDPVARSSERLSSRHHEDAIQRLCTQAPRRMARGIPAARRNSVPADAPLQRANSSTSRFISPQQHQKPGAYLDGD